MDYLDTAKHLIEGFSKENKRYALFGSGYIAEQLLLLIKSHFLKKPEFIFDHKLFNNQLNEYEVKNINEVSGEDFDAVITATNNSDFSLDMYNSLSEHFPAKSDAVFRLPAGPTVPVRGVVLEIEVNYIRNIDYLMCAIALSESFKVEKVEFFMDETKLGNANPYTTYKRKNTKEWRLEVPPCEIPAIDKEVNIKAVIYTANSKPFTKSINYSFSDKSSEPQMKKQLSEAPGSALVEQNLKTRKLIFISHFGLLGDERQHELTRKTMEETDKYLRLFNWQFVLLTHKSADTSRTSLDCLCFDVPEADACDISEEEVNFIEELAATQAVYTNINRVRNSQNSQSIAGQQVRYLKNLRYLCDKYSPGLFLIFTEYNHNSQLFKRLCRTLEIPYLISHSGWLLDSWQLDIGGEMGNCFPCREHDKFQNLDIDSQDLEKADKMIEMFITGRITRHVPTSTHNYLKEKLLNIQSQGWKILLYTACNDYLFGLMPACQGYTESSHTEFIDSFDAVEYLIRICRKNNWHLILKTHPQYYPESLKTIIERSGAGPDIVSHIQGSDMFELMKISDVNITIASTTAFESMQLDTPVVLLGMHPFVNKNIAYEARTAAKCENAVKEALEKVDWENKKSNFREFIARTIKYYLFPRSERAMEIMNRGYEEAARFMLHHVAKFNNKKRRQSEMEQ